MVRRIFRDYAAGLSSRTLAMALNREGVPGPQGRVWGPSTIHGNLERRNGVLNNELYVGRLVWNRQRFLKDPDTGKRIARPNPEAEWIVQDVPELRIVDAALWDAVRARQASLRMTPRVENVERIADRRRPKHLFSGLLRCACCGGSYTMISKDLLGCGAARTKGTCANRLNIRRDALEAQVLDGLRHHLMDPALFREFCEEFTREVNRLRMAETDSITAAQAELARVKRDIDRTIQAILDGVPGSAVKEKMGRLEARKEELTDQLAKAERPPPLLHPSLAQIYRERISSLSEALGRADTRAEAAEAIRSLVSGIELTPEDGRLTVVLRGDLAAMLAFASHKKKPGAPSLEAGLLGAVVAQESLGAGTGFEPVTFRL